MVAYHPGRPDRARSSEVPMRRVFLWAARNRWLKERLPRLRFMSRAVRRFMPGETLEDALAAALPLQAAGIGTLYTRLGENLEDLAAAEEVAAHYLEAVDKIVAAGITGEISVKPTQLGLDHDAGRLPCPPRPDRRARCRGRVVPLDRHGGQRVRRGDHRPVRAAARRPAPDRDLPAGIPAPHGGRHRAAAAAGPGDPPGQGRLRREGRDRLHRSPRRRFATTSGWPSASSSTVAAGRSGLGSGTHDVALIEQIAEQVGPAGIERYAFEVQMLYGIRTDQQFRLAKRGLSRPGPHRLRRILVSVVHAASRGAPGERLVRPPSDAPLSFRRFRMRLAARMGTIGTESAFEVSARARALEAQGRSIVHLQIGEPDFDTPANVREAAKAGARRRRDALPAVRRDPRAARGDRGGCLGAQGLPGRAGPGLRHGRWQGRDAVRDPRPGRPG